MLLSCWITRVLERLLGGLVWLGITFPWTGYAWSGLTLLPLIYGIFRNLRRRWTDYQTHRKIANREIFFDEFPGMLNVLSLFRTERALLLFVQDLKRQRVAMAHPAALRALQAFVTLAPARNRDLEMPFFLADRLDANELDELRRWFGSRADFRTRTVSQAVIDEVGKMVADSEAARLARS